MSINKKNKIVGYTTGVFDLFHIGHLNILKKAKLHCDYLIVGVATDELSESIKGYEPFIPLSERIEIVKSIRYTDEVQVQHKTDEIGDWERLKFNKLFKGSDWAGTEKWNSLQEEFNKRKVEVIFFQYTELTSSTKLKEKLKKEFFETD